ncbi:phenylalanine--tRNA ligase subunit beta [Candidatus Peregrinibacteria bacterium]|nr:phenylalanine--tRNA ligase subunit beta [Candidatus Peregrinibacteria bacterium]
MKISLKWLREFTDIPEMEPEELGKIFTLRTAEVEHVIDQKKSFENMVIGKVESVEKHPDADKLIVTKTNISDKTVQIVCGAPNVKENMLVPIALPGSYVRWHGEGDLIKLEKAKIRGVESFGMICAGEEIGLEPDPEGIVDLSHLNVEAGTPLAEALGMDDIIIDIDNKSLTHRPDLWGHYGIAREMAAIFKTELKPFKTNVSYPAADESELKIEVKNPDLCPRYTGVKITDVKIESSPKWLQQRLLSIGHGTYNNIVDATNLVMEELGQPLHAFDAAKIKGGIVVRRANKDEKMTALDGTETKLQNENLVIADYEKPVALAGIIGGEHSKVDESTTELILEAANFAPANVRRTSTELGIRTDSVQRFEKSLDPNLPSKAMDRLCELILKLCPGAKIVSTKKDVKNFDESPTLVTIDLNRINSKIGADVPKEQVIDILTRLEFSIIKNDSNLVSVEVPSFRATKDVSLEDDLTEEIARLYGYENIEPVLPDQPIKIPEENIERKLKHYARQILSKGLGFNEVYQYSFYGKQDIENCLLPEELHIKVDNYLSEDQTHMRISLIPNLLKVVGKNISFEDKINIYEIGHTYEDLQEYFPKEEKKICGIIAANAKKYRGTPFYEAKGALESLLSFYNFDDLELRKGESLCTYAHPNKYGAYYDKQGTEIARVFELHPLVAKKYNLDKVKIAAFEVNFTALAANGWADSNYEPVSKYPSITFDVSVVIDKQVEVGQIMDQIKKSDRELIKEIVLFDLYEGENIPVNKKSCAFTITLQANDRTLKDEEMKRIQQDIFDRLQKLGGEIRGLK